MSKRSFLFHTAGIYICFLVFSVYQEKISTSYKHLSYPKTLLPMYLQSLGGIVASEISFHYKKEKKIYPQKSLFSFLTLLSILTLISVQLWSFSLNFLSYPTIVISKSCKLLSIAIMNFLVYKKTLGKRKYFLLLLTSFSVLLFALSDTKKKESSSSWTGLFLLIINLSIDGYINVLQDNIFKKYQVSSLNMMYYFNVVRLFTSLILLAGTKNIYNCINIMIAHPGLTLDLTLSTICNVIGQLFIYAIIEKYGTLTLSTVNVTRKMASILISFLIFGHSLSLLQWVSICGVMISIGLELVGKEKKIKNL